MVPSLGRTVLYRLSEQDVQRVNERRRRHVVAIEWENEHGRGVAEHHAFEGNDVVAGDVFPMEITRVWGTEEGCSVNGQVKLDGDDTLWVTSVCEWVAGADPETGEWPERHWVVPPRVG